MIGRDLVRLLQNVARIPEFEQLWKDIIHNPQALSPQFTGRHKKTPRSTLRTSRVRSSCVDAPVSRHGRSPR